MLVLLNSIRNWRKNSPPIAAEKLSVENAMSLTMRKFRKHSNGCEVNSVDSMCLSAMLEYWKRIFCLVSSKRFIRNRLCEINFRIKNSYRVENSWFQRSVWSQCHFNLCFHSRKCEIDPGKITVRSHYHHKQVEEYSAENIFSFDRLKCIWPRP